MGLIPEIVLVTIANRTLRPHHDITKNQQDLNDPLWPLFVERQENIVKQVMKHSYSGSQGGRPSKRSRVEGPIVQPNPHSKHSLLEDLIGLPPSKKQRIHEPPVHTKSFLVQTKLE